MVYDLLESTCKHSASMENVSKLAFAYRLADCYLALWIIFLKETEDTVWNKLFYAVIMVLILSEECIVSQLNSNLAKLNANYSRINKFYHYLKILGNIKIAIILSFSFYSRLFIPYLSSITQNAALIITIYLSTLLKKEFILTLVWLTLYSFAEQFFILQDTITARIQILISSVFFIAFGCLIHNNYSIAFSSGCVIHHEMSSFLKKYSAPIIVWEVGQGLSYVNDSALATFQELRQMKKESFSEFLNKLKKKRKKGKQTSSAKTMEQIIHKLSFDKKEFKIQVDISYECFAEVPFENESLSSSSSLLEVKLEKKVKEFKVTLSSPTFLQTANNGVAIVFEDVTELNKYYSLKASEQLKDSIIATISHELRTPLNGVIGSLEILNQSISLKERKYVNIAISSSLLLSNSAQSMLDYAQIEMSKFKLKKTKFKLNSLKKDISFIFQNQIELRENVKFVVEKDPALPRHLFNDLERIKAILIHFLSNAVNYTYKGTIWFRMIQLTRSEEEKCDLIRFEVEDTGFGMSQEQAKKIGILFGNHNFHNDYGEKLAGLGLTICNMISRELKTQIRVKTNNSHRTHGTRIWFDLEIETRGLTSQKSLNSVLSEDFSLSKRESEFSLKSSPSRRFQNHGTPKSKLPSLPKVRHKQTFSSRNVCNSLKLQEALPLESQTVRTQNSHINTDSQKSSLREAEETVPVLKEEEEEEKRNKHTNLYKGSFCEHLDMPNFLTCSFLPLASPLKQTPAPLIRERRALVVDDNEVNKFVLCKMLNKLNIPTHSASNGREAVHCVKTSDQPQNAYALIFMDIQMPIMDGIEATINLNAFFRNANLPPIPVVAVTAFNTAQDEAKCLNAGMQKFIPKPVTLNAVQKLVDYYF
jgi:signal transduction histidine kinase/CheY-like chemotaxis protein